jgi:hypothetical protein
VEDKTFSYLFTERMLMFDFIEQVNILFCVLVMKFSNVNLPK